MDKLLKGILVLGILQGLYYLLAPRDEQQPSRELTSLTVEAIKETDQMLKKTIVRGKDSSKQVPAVESRTDSTSRPLESGGPLVENEETKLVKSQPKTSGKSIDTPKDEPLSDAVIEAEEKLTSFGKPMVSSSAEPIEMPKVELPPQIRLLPTSEVLSSKRKISDLFGYIRADRVVLKASVQTVDGALKLLEIAQRVWGREKIEFSIDWGLDQAEKKIEGEGCLTEKSSKKYVVEAVTEQNVNSCIYIGQVEALSSANPTLKEKTVNRIYFTSGPEFTDSFTALAPTYRHKLAFFDQYLRKEEGE